MYGQSITTDSVTATCCTFHLLESNLTCSRGNQAFSGKLRAGPLTPSLADTSDSPRELDTTLGDAVAALPPAARDSTAYRALSDAALAFATAALRYRLDSAPTVRLLRRFLAALLPPDGGNDGSDDGRAGPSRLPSGLYTPGECKASR
jgi:hypothetical protein